ncbi:hypothetical protein [Taibaiella koreensis]|uniref:hypothetical protein n=1 Tax=Taibaiella koreensis TaxID=1268548 RepID=UPI000E59C25C|nr:hypothetical protein [Taibaiella koreensis]
MKKKQTAPKRSLIKKEIVPLQAGALAVGGKTAPLAGGGIESLGSATKAIRSVLTFCASCNTCKDYCAYVAHPQPPICN